MKRLIAFLLLMIIPTFCFGDKYDDVEQDSTFKYLQEYREIMRQQLPIIEERMKQIDPDLVESYNRCAKGCKIQQLSGRKNF